MREHPSHRHYGLNDEIEEHGYHCRACQMAKALDKPLTDKERRIVDEVYDKAHLEQQLAAVRAVEENKES